MYIYRKSLCFKESHRRNSYYVCKFISLLGGTTTKLHKKLAFASAKYLA